MVRPLIWCLPILLTAAGITEAQQPTGRSLSGQEIRQLFLGRTMVVDRSYWVDHSKGSPQQVHERVRYYMEFREDGSYALRCGRVDRTGERPCYPNPRYIGVWEIRGNEICSAPVGVRKERFTCYEVTAQTQSRLYLRQTNAQEVPSNGTGPVDLQ